MSEDQIASLEEIFRTIFELPDTADPRTVQQAEQESWDSASHVSLVIALESEFGVEIDPADALRLTSFQATCAVLEEKGA